MWRNHGSNLVKRAMQSTLRPTYALVGPSYCSNAGAAFSGGGGTEKSGGSVSYAEAKRLMRLVNVEALKEKLGKEDREVIPYDELVKACQAMGVAKTPNEAAVYAGVLDDAGVVLLFRNKVYLHPNKVIDVVRSALMAGSVLGDEDDGHKDELMKLQEEKDKIDMAAHKQVRRILWTGLGLSIMQVSLFFRLTFWEFSWDVMEPIAFFTTTSGIVLGYAYFMITSTDPSYQDFLKRLFLSRQRKLIKRRNFDVGRFLQLQKQSNQPLDYSCASIKKRLGIELHPDDLLQHDR